MHSVEGETFLCHWHPSTEEQQGTSSSSSTSIGGSSSLSSSPVQSRVQDGSSQASPELIQQTYQILHRVIEQEIQPVFESAGQRPSREQVQGLLWQLDFTLEVKLHQSKRS